MIFLHLIFYDIKHVVESLTICITSGASPPPHPPKIINYNATHPNISLQHWCEGLSPQEMNPARLSSCGQTPGVKILCCFLKVFVALHLQINGYQNLIYRLVRICQVIFLINIYMIWKSFDFVFSF